jgi:hypothetical protein
MDRLRTVALIAYAAPVAGIIGLGAAYLLRSEFLPYHAQAMGVEWAQVPGNTRVLLLALIHLFGAFALGAGLALSAVLLTAFRKRQSWAEWTIPSLLAFLLAAATLVPFHVARSTGAQTPWLAGVAGLFSTLVGIVCSVLGRRR